MQKISAVEEPKGDINNYLSLLIITTTKKFIVIKAPVKDIKILIYLKRVEKI